MKTSTLAKTSLMAAAGVALATFGSASSASAIGTNLVTNGGFETGDFSGWTQSGNTDFTLVSNWAANTGNYSATFGPVGSLGFISQDLGTTAGVTYDLTYFLQGGGTPNQFQVLINGSSIFDSTDVSLGSFTPNTLSFVATGSSTNLSFGFRNDPSYLYLDDVSVTAVPTPALVPGAVALCAGLLRKRKAEATEEASEA